MKVPDAIVAADLKDVVRRTLSPAADKVRLIAGTWDAAAGTPVCTVDGKYASRGWTEWTQRFQYGAAILAFAGTGDESLLRLSRDGSVRHMAAHVTHTGVYDHGFNNMSTCGGCCGRVA